MDKCCAQSSLRVIWQQNECLQSVWEQKHTNSSTSCFSSSLTVGICSSAGGCWFSLGFTSLGFGSASSLTAGAPVGAAGRGSSFGGGLVSCCSGGRLWDPVSAFFCAASWRALSRCNCCRLRLDGAGFLPRAATACPAESENTHSHDYYHRFLRRINVKTD